VHHWGALVRDRLSITIREWKKKKEAPHISFVSDRDKELLWDEVITHFGLPPHLDYDTKKLVQS
jgi:hypothetical protein